MKRFALAIALACVLSGSALAGDIATPGIASPVPGETHSPPGETQGPGLLETLILAIITLPR